tara:strand:- start:42964 stop:43881 length:918 start_codon:yes stop_codon:yes gene_type:complete
VINKRFLCYVLSLCLVISFISSCGHQPVHIYTQSLPPIPKPLKEINIALALGGGGARGIAHAGVLSVFEENHIPIDLIVGTSAGSIVGALYADNPNSQMLKEKLLKLNKWSFLDFNIKSGVKMLWKVSGMIEGHALRRYLKNTLQFHDFSMLSIPLAVVTTDIELGRPYTIRSGAIIPAVHASSAVPLVFTPVPLYGRQLVDGGVMSPVPVEIARQLGAKHVIAVDIGDVLEPIKVKGMYQLADRCLWLSYMALSNWQNHHADVLVQPKFLNSGMFDDSQLEVNYELGRQAALQALPEIKILLNT